MNFKFEKNKEQEKKERPKMDKSKLLVRIMAGILAGLMVLATATTLLYYLFVA